MRHGRGFTIIELMLAIVVLGILAALAVPSFNRMIARNHLSAASNDLVVALLTARSEAVKRECQVTVTSASWKDGWTANVLSNISGCTAQQIVNHEVSSKNMTITMVYTDGNDSDTVTYGPEGRTVPLAGENPDFFTLTVDDHDPATPDPAKVVCLTLFGRPYVPDTPYSKFVQTGGDC